MNQPLYIEAFGDKTFLRLFIALIFPIALAAAPLPRFQEHVIATDLKGGYQVVAADVNHDGKVDLIALASGMTELVWFENPGWQRHVIATGLKRMINLAVMDIDGDGIPEILVAHGFENLAKNSAGIVTLLESHGKPLEPWTTREIDRLTTSHRLRVANGIFINAPLTGANADAPDYRDHVPLVSYKPGEWKRQTISNTDEGVAHGILINDWNSDGLQDILTASFLGIHVNLAQKDGTWKRVRITPGDPAPWPKGGSSDIAIGKLLQRRFLSAIEPWHGNQVVVYNERRSNWKRQVIDTSLVDGHTIITADLNNDGQDEIIAGFRGEGRSVYIYAMEKNKWTRHDLDKGGIAAAACIAVDLNADGRMDIACIGSATSNLKWYENRGR